MTIASDQSRPFQPRPSLHEVAILLLGYVCLRHLCRAGSCGMTVQGAKVSAHGMPIAQPSQARHAASDNQITVQRSESNILLACTVPCVMMWKLGRHSIAIHTGRIRRAQYRDVCQCLIPPSHREPCVLVDLGRAASFQWAA